MNIAILASGDGSNFQAIVEAARAGAVSAEVVGVISNRPGVRVVDRARNLKVPSAIFALRDFPSSEEWNRALLKQLQEWNAEWVILAGFTGLIGAELLHAFPSRIVNSHPSLLPKFGGKGMYGNKVHEAVLLAKETETGITVHLLNERFDEGPIIAQKKVPIEPSDTLKTLSERLKACEREFYPKVLQELLTGRIKSR